MCTIFEQSKAFLDEDERLVFPEQYQKTPWLYDLVRGVVYLVRSSDPDRTVDWVWERQVSRLDGKTEILAKLILVRLRPADASIPVGNVISAEELQADPGRYQVLDSYVVVIAKAGPEVAKYITTDMYQLFHDDYELIGVSYLVRPAFTGDD